MSSNESPFQGLAEKIRGGKSPSTLELEGRKPRITISRRTDGTQGVGLVQRALLSYRNLIASSKFTILIDDDEVGHIESGEQVTIEVAAGERKIRIKAFSSQSAQFQFDLENGDHIRLRCCAKLTGIALYR